MLHIGTDEGFPLNPLARRPAPSGGTHADQRTPLDLAPTPLHAAPLVPSLPSRWRIAQAALGYCQVMEHACPTLPPDARFVACSGLYSGCAADLRQK